MINAAALVGGIKVNSEKRRFIYDNLVIQTNLIHGAYLSNVKNFIFLGSSCIYTEIPSTDKRKSTSDR